MRVTRRQGVFAVWDMGSRDGVGLRLKKALGRQETPPDPLEMPGYALHKKGCVRRFLGKGVEGTKEIREAVAGIFGRAEIS